MRVLWGIAILGALVGCAQGGSLVTAKPPDLALNGPMEQGGLIVGRTAPGIEVSLDGAPLMVDGQGRFVFGFDRDAPVAAKLEARGPGGYDEIRTLNVAPRTWDIQKIDGLPPEQVNPTPAELEQIKREAVLKRAARKPDTQGSWFTEHFIWPAQGSVSGVFGSQRILNGEARSPHYGLDIAAPEGAPVTAPAGGIVRLAATEFYFEGGLVFIDHGHGLVSYMMHMSRVDVHAGQEVKQGETIGAVGKTGRATGPHLHWGMFWLDAHIDPQLLVPAQATVPPKE